MKFIIIAVLSLFPIISIAQSSKQDSLKRVIKGEVIITSTRTYEKKTDAPMSVSTVGEKQFNDTRGYELKDALSYVPGVFSQSRSGTSDDRITIRGFGARGAGDRSNAGNLRGIRILVDGFPETEPDGRTSLDNIDLNSYSRVEVMRSNASTLYGSAAGGVISLFTNTNFSSPFIEEQFRLGGFGYMKNTLSAGTVTGGTQIYASFSNTTYDGFRGDTVLNDAGSPEFRSNSRSSAGNAKLFVRSELGENTNLLINASAASNIFRFPGPLTWEQFEENLYQSDSTYAARDEHRFNRVGRIGLTLDHAMAGGHSVSGTVFLQPKVLTRSERGTWREFNRYSIGSSANYAWDIDINESTSNTVLVGYDQQYQDGTIQFWVLGPGASRSNDVSQNKREAASNVGMYFQDQISLGNVTIIAGARYDILRYKTMDFTGALPDAEKEFTGFTPKLSLGYKLNEDMLIYAAYGGGLEAPAFNEIDPPDTGTFNPPVVFNPFLEPAKSTSIELGTRGLLSSDAMILSYELALFNIDVTNDIVPWRDGRYYFTAAKTNRKGAEIALAAHLDFGLTARAAFTLIDAKYDEYTNNNGVWDGNKQAGVPDKYGRLSLRYDTELGLYIEAGMDHVGEYYGDDRNDQIYENGVRVADPNNNSLAPAFTIFDATVGYRGHIFDALDIGIFANIANLTDSKYISSVFINGTSNRYFEPGMPRNVTGGISLSYSFGK